MLFLIEMYIEFFNLESYAISEFQIKQKFLSIIEVSLYIHNYLLLTSVFAIVQSFLFTVFWYLLQ